MTTQQLIKAVLAESPKPKVHSNGERRREERGDETEESREEGREGEGKGGDER